jgi:HAD superfamily hydrolase (TIGR01493 family)
VLFDLLTALLDSWTVWNRAAGSESAGRAWRAEYLRRTYGCGAYQPYEELVEAAAAAVGLPAELPVWDGARELLQALRPHCRLGVVTNCSDRLGRRAAGLLGVDWDVVVTSEEAGFYKPDPRPYERALARLQVEPSQAAFVAGSGYDMFGTSKVGLRTYWHNRVGLALPEGAARPERESPRLEAALPWLARFNAG